MGDPGAVEPGPGLTPLVVADAGEGALVGRGVAAAGYQRGHAAHRVRAAAVAGADQQLGVGPHERDGHRDVGPVG